MIKKTPMQRLRYPLTQLANALPDFNESNTNKKRSELGSDFTRTFIRKEKASNVFNIFFHFQEGLESSIVINFSRKFDKSDLAYSELIPEIFFKDKLAEILSENPRLKNESLIKCLVDMFITGDAKSEISQSIKDRKVKTEKYRLEMEGRFIEICQPSLDMAKKYDGSARAMMVRKQNKVSKSLESTHEYKEVERIEKLLRKAENDKKEKCNMIARQQGFYDFSMTLKGDSEKILSCIINSLKVMLEGYEELSINEKYYTDIMIAKKISELSEAHCQIKGYELTNNDREVSFLLKQCGIQGNFIR